MSDQRNNSSSGKTTKPYLIRAIYEWSLDNELTPQVLVSVDQPEVEVPREYSKDGQIVLNLHPQSIRHLELGNEYVMFSARFAGKPFEVIIPVAAVLAVYARENGQGIVFQADGSGMTPPPEDQPQDTESTETPEKKPKGSAHLKLVK